MMRSATAFLPPSMITFMNLDSSTLPNFGSGRISRLGTSRRRGIFSPLLLQLVFLQTPRELINKTLTYSTRTSGHFVYLPRHAANKHLLINQLSAYLTFGFFAPYLERDCLRSFTPCKS